MVVAMHAGTQLATTTLSKKWLIYVDRRHFPLFLINGVDRHISTTFYIKVVVASNISIQKVWSVVRIQHLY